jgi:hypothetical protein
MVRTRGTRATKGSKQIAGRGAGGYKADSLTALADRNLGTQSRKVVAKLVEEALHGKSSCTRLLVDLSEKSRVPNACDKKQSSISLAKTWSAEAEWIGESSEAIAEMASGSREPEG